MTAFGVLRQLRNPLLLLLLAAAGVSGLTGDPTDAVIIAAIVVLSVGLGFVNEYRAANAVAALHADIHHRRAGLARRRARSRADVTALVPGDVVALRVGDVVPADLRLLEATRLECDEAVLTGESLPVEKSVDAVAAGDSPLDLPSCAFMGTVVHQGAGRGVVVVDRPGHGVRPDRRRPRRAAGRDRVPGRAARLLAPAREGRRRADGLDLRDQRRPSRGR